MAAVEIEVVARPIEIGGEQVDGVESVLGPVGLSLDEEHLLGEAVGSVRLLRVSVPEIRFHEGYRGVLRILADRADADELGHAGLARALHHLESHDRVVEEEAARVRLIRSNATHDGGEMDDHVRPRLGVEPLDGVPVAKVVGL